MNFPGRILALLIPAILAFAPIGQAAEYLVLPDGTGDYPTIGAAITAATDGDVILLGDGTFRGPGNRNLSYLGKTLVIRSQSGNPDACHIDCQSSDPGPQRAFVFLEGEEPKTRLEGVTIWNGRADLTGDVGGAILIGQGSSATLANCVFFGNRAFEGGAVYIDDESISSIESCRFLYNAADQLGGALQVSGQSQVQVEGCVFWRNWAPWGGALGCDYSIVLDRGNTYVENGSADVGAIGAYGGSIVMEGTIVAFSASGPAIEYESGTVWLYCCDLFGNSGGDWVGWLALQLGTEGNICADPLFCDLQTGSVDVHAGSPCEASPAGTSDDTCVWIGAGRVGCGPAADGGTPAAANAPDPVPAAANTPDPVRAAPCAGGAILQGPNPLRAGDRLAWTLAAEPGVGTGNLAILIHDATGRRLRVLEAGTAGTGTAGTGASGMTWDGNDETGRPLARGVYFFSLESGGRSLVTRSFIVP
jgi:hypothetical protein